MKDTGCNYNRTSALIASATLTLAALSTPANAWVVPTDMSGEGRLGLTAAGEIMDAGSDEASLAFQKEVLPDLTAFLNTQLSEYQKVDPSTMLLDSSQLELKNASDVRVYFVGEGASYHNTLGYTTDGSGSLDSGTASVIFPDASTSVSTFDLTDFVKRTGNAPLAPGDFVDLGTLDAGTLLDFFLIADGARGGDDVYSTETSVNPDGINHVVAFSYVLPDSPYLIIGFEDMYGGGDGDYNDLLFAVDIGVANIKALTANSEPGFAFILGGFGAAAWWRRRRAASQS